MSPRREVIMRRRNGCSLAQISKDTGVSLGTIATWLTNAGLTRRHVWRPDKLHKLAYCRHLRRSGMTYQDIGDEIGVSHSTVSRWLKLVF